MGKLRDYTNEDCDVIFDTILDKAGNHYTKGSIYWMTFERFYNKYYNKYIQLNRFYDGK